MQQILKTKTVGIGAATFLIAAMWTILSIGMPTSAKAAVSSDVQYSTILDYSSTNALIEQSGFVASSTYNCVLATAACTQVPSTTENLVPSTLQNLSYFANDNYTEALVTTYNPGATPTETLDTIQDDTLTQKAALPALNSLVTNVRWSGDGNVLILSESDGSTQKYTASTNTLTSLSNSVPSGASWTTVSPDGRYIAYMLPATQTQNTRTIGVIDTTLDKSYTFNDTVNYWDLLTEGVREFAFSPNSSTLLYLDDRSGYQTLYEVKLANLATDGLTGTPITTKQYSIEDMVWVDNSNILFSANRSEPMQWSLYELNLNTYNLSKISDWIAYNQAMVKQGSYVLFQTADANGRLTKIFNTQTKTITTLAMSAGTELINGTTNAVTQVNGLYGVYMKPSTATSTLLVWLHGGPDRQDAIEYNSYMSYGGYDWVLNQVKQAGVPVLKLDYPGSLGYGRAFAESIIGGVGTVDASTTMQAINEFAQQHGYTHIYLMGNSYGGYLALKLLVSYPQQIDGVLSASGVTDWQSLLTNVPSSIFAVDFDGAPNTNNQSLYDKASILDNVQNIGTQKVILMQGNADTEVPYQQSVIMNEALLAAGKNVEYYTLDGENHIYEQPSSYTLLCNKTMELIGLPSTPSCVMQ